MNELCSKIDVKWLWYIWFEFYKLSNGIFVCDYSGPDAAAIAAAVGWCSVDVNSECLLTDTVMLVIISRCAGGNICRQLLYCRHKYSTNMFEQSLLCHIDNINSVRFKQWNEIGMHISWSNFLYKTYFCCSIQTVLNHLTFGL